MSQEQKGWGSLLHHWGKDFQLLLFIAVSLQLFRLVLIGWFGEQATTLAPGVLLSVIGNGLRYDLSTAAVWALPTFLLSLLVTLLPVGRPIAALRRFSATLYSVVAMLVFGIDLVYFDEYNDQFNQHLFGIVHDDTVAILVTVWKEYHPLLFAALLIPALAAGVWLVRRWLAWSPAWLRRITPERHGWARRLTIGTALFLLFIAAGRGGTLWGEPIRLKHAFVVNDLFLNRTVVNPFTALRYTLESHYKARQRGGFKTVWSGGIDDAVRVVTGGRPAPGVSLDHLLTRRAKGPPVAAPRHIFLIANESHSGWTVMPAYRDIGLSPALSRLAEQGLYFPHFLPAEHGTVASMNALITGLPDAGLNINYEVESLRPYPSGSAATFKRLGYKTRFFYGGFLSWQRLDSFTYAQGFDEVYGGGEMAAGADRTNEWGVDDAFLFDYVLAHTDDSAPTFNFILTTSNHPPYDLDLKRLGFPVERLPEALTPTKAETLKVLGHLWYSDLQLGRFVTAAEQQLPQALFAITGDHTSRLGIRFPGDNVMEQYAVPFVLYGPSVLPPPQQFNTAGSHVDVPATLFELAAPKGFEYVAFGEDLLRKTSPSYAHGYRFLVGENFIASHTEPPHIWRLPDGSRPLPAAAELEPVVKRFNALKALSWYRVRHGTTLPQ